MTTLPPSPRRGRAPRARPSRGVRPAMTPPRPPAGGRPPWTTTTTTSLRRRAALAAPAARAPPPTPPRRRRRPRRPAWRTLCGRRARLVVSPWRMATRRTAAARSQRPRRRRRLWPRPGPRRLMMVSPRAARMTRCMPLRGPACCQGEEKKRKQREREGVFLERKHGTALSRRAIQAVFSRGVCRFWVVPFFRGVCVCEHKGGTKKRRFGGFSQGLQILVTSFFFVFSPSLPKTPTMRFSIFMLLALVVLLLQVWLGARAGGEAVVGRAPAHTIAPIGRRPVPPTDPARLDRSASPN